MSRISEKMTESNFDEGMQEIYGRMKARRANNFVPASHTVPTKLEFDSNFIDETAGNSMLDIISYRRQKAAEEEEKLKRMGSENYVRNNGGPRQMRMLYDANGDMDIGVMRALQKYQNEATAMTKGAFLDGKLETDLSFMEQDPKTGDSILAYEGLKQSRRSCPVPAESSTSARDVREFTLAAGKKIVLPLISSRLSKIRITVEYKEGTEHKQSNIELVKKSSSTGPKTVNIDISGEGKVITMGSILYMFEAMRDTYTDLTAKLTGANVVEASITLI